MKTHLLWACGVAVSLGIIAWLWTHPPAAVQEAIEHTDATISQGKDELQAAYERAEQMTQTTVTRIVERKAEVKANVEAMDDDMVATTIEFELALWRSGDGTEGLHNSLSGVSVDFAGRPGTGYSITTTPVGAE